MAERIARNAGQRTADLARINALNRLYALLSAINQAIIAPASREELFTTVCRIAVEVGGFRLAWVGLPVADGSAVVPAFSHGTVGHLDGLRLRLDDPVAIRGPTLAAIRSGRIDICNDIAADPRMAPWRERMLAGGFHASVAIPLREEGRVIGMLALYAAAPGFFDPEEITLLAECGEDIGHALDVMAQRAALDDTRRLLRAVIDASRVVIYVFDRDGRCLLSNQRFGTLVGLDPEQMLGKTREEMLPAAVAAQHRDNDLAILASGASQTIEEPNAEADGMHDYLSVKFPLRDAGGAIYAVGGISTDITAEKCAERALRESEAKYRQTLDTMLEGCQIVGFDWRYTYINATAEHHNRRPGAELLGRTVMECWPGITGTEVFAMERSCMDERTAHRLDTRFTFPDGDVGWFRVIIQPVTEGIAIYSEDITQRKQAEEEVRRLNANLEALVAERTRELEETNRELESFSYSVSHDLRAPLRAISGFSDSLLRRHSENLNDEGRHYLDNVRTAADRMAGMIEDLLRYSRVGRAAVEARPVPLAPLLEMLCQTFAARIAETGAVLDIVEPLATPKGDPRLIEQCLANLLDNALKYLRAAGTPRITLSARDEGAYTKVSVSDNGIGIPIQYHDKVFDVFVRLHSEDDYPGTGIGLAIVRKCARLMGGDAGIESGQAVGSTFWLRLPTPNPDGSRAP